MSTAMRVPDNGPSRSTRSAISAALPNQVGGPLRDGHDGGVAVARRYRRHDARVDDAHAAHAAHAQGRVDDRPGVDADAAGAGLGGVAVGTPPPEPPHGG